MGYIVNKNPFQYDAYRLSEGVYHMRTRLPKDMIENITFPQTTCAGGKNLPELAAGVGVADRDFAAGDGDC